MILVVSVFMKQCPSSCKEEGRVAASRCHTQTQSLWLSNRWRCVEGRLSTGKAELSPGQPGDSVDLLVSEYCGGSHVLEIKRSVCF